MKKRGIKSVKVVVETKQKPRFFLVPENKAQGILKLIEEFESSKEFVSPDEAFEDLHKKYTKPGAVLQGARLKEELSQLQLAEKINITQGDLSKMEAGKRPIGKEMAKRLAKVLNVDYRIFL